MRILFVTPSFPPQICGVGDHTYFLAEAMRARGHNLAVATRDATAKERFSKLSIIATEVNTYWNFSALSEWQPDCIVIAYTSYLWGKYGLHPGFNLWVSKLKQTFPQQRLILLAHELHYPVLPTKAGLTLGICQKLQYELLERNFSQVLYTYEKVFLKRPQRPQQKPLRSWLPVGSNIPVAPMNRALHESLRASILTATDKLCLWLHFGGNHPTHAYELLPHLLERAEADAPELTHIILCIGIHTSELNARLGASASGTKIRALGKLSAEEISHWLQACDAVFAPFTDGISARRGSAIAALAHARILISNLGYHSDPSLPWHEGVLLAPSIAAADFNEPIKTALQSIIKKSTALEKQADFFRNYFSWPRIAEKFESWLR